MSSPRPCPPRRRPASTSSSWSFRRTSRPSSRSRPSREGSSQSRPARAEASVASRALRLAVVGALLLAASAVTLGSASAGGSAQARQAILAPPNYPVHPWTAATDNLVPAQGTIVLHGSPVAGASVRVDHYDHPRPTDANGHFVYLLDDTLLQRHVVTVTDVSHATVGGQPLTDADRADLLASRASINVAYTVKGL